MTTSVSAFLSSHLSFQYPEEQQKPAEKLVMDIDGYRLQFDQRTVCLQWAMLTVSADSGASSQELHRNQIFQKDIYTLPSEKKKGKNEKEKHCEALWLWLLATLLRDPFLMFSTDYRSNEMLVKYI